MTLPHVTVITPTTPDRARMMERLAYIISNQDYKGDMLHIKDDTNITIGEKLNAMSFFAPEIILRADSDDIYAPDWITKSVAALQTSGADIVGLSNAYFYQTQQQQLYELRQHPNRQLYLCGATLCYWRHVWERKQFKDTSHGEDTDFISNNGRLHCHGYKEGFIATVHGGNTECHKALPMMHKSSATPPLLRSWYP